MADQSVVTKTRHTETDKRECRRLVSLIEETDRAMLNLERSLLDSLGETSESVSTMTDEALRARISASDVAKKIRREAMVARQQRKAYIEQLFQILDPGGRRLN